MNDRTKVLKKLYVGTVNNNYIILGRVETNTIPFINK